MYGRKVAIQAELDELYAEEEMHWIQKTHENWILKGDQNTAYFHRIANGKKRKKYNTYSGRWWS